MSNRIKFIGNEAEPEQQIRRKASKKSVSIYSLFAKPKNPIEGAEPPVEAEVNSCEKFQKDKMFWAMRNLPISEAVKNFLVCGMVGSGKTIAIKLLLQSIAPRFKAGFEHPEQLIIFDAKSDIIPTLAANGLTPDQENFYILNPFDERSMIWDLGEAVQQPALARGFATLLVPEEKSSSAPFFASAARDLVNAVILALNHIVGTKWTFRDLLCALESKRNIQDVAARHPRSKAMVDQLLGDKQHYHAVLSTLSTKLNPYHQTAALWHTSNSNKRFSIADFLSKPGVLVLGNDPVLRSSLWPINSAMLSALTAAILRGENVDKPAHWFVFDEFRAMEKLDSMKDLLNRGRSKGASVTLGIQSVEGLMDIYEENGTEDLLGQCSSKSFVRVGSPKTAKWASDVFGSVRWQETSLTENHGKDYSYSTQTGLKDRPLLLPSYFLNLPFPGPGRSYTMVSDVPALDSTYISTRKSETVFTWLKTDDLSHPSVIPRNNIEDQILTPWSAEQRAFYCGNPKRKPRKPEAAKDSKGAKTGKAKKIGTKRRPRRNKT